MACQCSRADEQGFSRPEVPRQARAPSPNPGTVHRTQVCLGGAGSGSKPPDAHPRSGGEKKGRRRANLSIRAAQSLFPEFDDSRRKFTPSNSGASAGFRPHLKQGVIFTEQVALGNLVSFRPRPSLGCHFQELDERGDVLFVGVHDNPPSYGPELTHNNGCRCVGHHEKTR